MGFGWYLRVADHGYDVLAATAFFPLYPLLVRGGGFLLGSHLVAGVLLSLVAAGIGAVLVSRIAVRFAGAKVASDTVLLLALYPSALVFTGVYSDGLYFALAAGALLAAVQGRSWVAHSRGLAVATRLIGLALLPALLVLLWPRDRSLTQFARPLPLLMLPAALGLYLLTSRAVLAMPSRSRTRRSSTGSGRRLLSARSVGCGQHLGRLGWSGRARAAPST